MKHEFTDDQLRQDVADFLSDDGVDLGVSAFGDFFWTQQVRALRKMLDALPEPDDEWQECSTGDLLMTDRFKVEGPGWTFEGEVKQLGATIVCYDPRNGKPIYANTFDADDDLALYRIPAPVQHPDPAEHPVIVIRDSEHGHDQPAVALWHGGEYKYTDDHGTPQWLLPHQITDWHPIDPAKVVADDA